MRTPPMGDLQQEKRQDIHEVVVRIISCVFLSLRGPLCAAPVPGEIDIS